MAAFIQNVNIILPFILICASISHATNLPFSHGILVAQNEVTEGSFCVVYYPNITTFPEKKTEANNSVIDLTTWDPCSNNNTSVPQISDHYVIITNGNCSLVKQAQHVQDLGAKGVLIVSAKVINLSDKETYEINLPLALIGKGSKNILLGLGINVQISIYAPDEDGSLFDYCLLVIWSLAVLTVGIGAYWSGIVRHDLQKKKQLIANGDVAPEEDKLQEEVSLSVTPKLVGVFVFCMCGMLLLLYFFFSYLVYIIIALFVVASTTAVYQCLEPLVRRIPIGSYKLPICNVSCIRMHAEIRQIFLFVGAVSLSACWLYYRKEHFSWVLQDILGVAFSINMIRQVRLPSLKICTLLLVMLFFYDIFFVFITPLLTKSGKSVMVEVATGGGTSVSGGTGGSSSVSDEEQLPMVIRVPHLGYDPLSVCWQRYSLLGFGDILVPGMLVGFCHGFDLATSSRHKIYYVTTVIAYGIGLLVTFASLYLMAMAQPALLYLVPFTLIPVLVLGLARRELITLWHGDGQVQLFK